MKTAAVISYCSYQKEYIKPLLKEARKFINGEIVVVSFDRFFDGRKEEPLKSFGEIDLRLKFVGGHQSRYYHNLQRKAGFDILQGEYDGVYFFDGDEVPIGDQMKLWQDQAEIANYRFASYWYYRDTCFQADDATDSLALVSMKSLKEDAKWFSNNEREEFAKYESWHRLTRYMDKPLVHHYAWAGTKEKLLRKVRSWGHNEDRDWVQMVNDEFSHEFDYTCPFREYDKYKLVKPAIGFTFNNYKK